MEDQRTAMQATFDRHMEQQRLVNQIEQFNFESERARVALRLEAARLGVRLTPLPLWRKALGVTGTAIVKVFQYARRGLR
jgi:hypothetical protein